MNIIDKAISILAPGRALQREQSRQALEVIQSHGQRRYDAAAVGRRTQNWPGARGSINTEMAFDLNRLRARSRDLVQNNSYAARAIQVIQNNGVGSGIVLAPDANAQTTEKKILDNWRAWAESLDIDFDGRHNFYGIQSLALRTVAESGECIIRRRRRNSNGGKLPIQLQVCEPDFIDTNRNFQAYGTNQEHIIHGVHFDTNGRRIGYWLFDRNPYDYYQARSKFVPIEDVIHLYRIDRPGQVRGIPWGASAMMKLKDYD